MLRLFILLCGTCSQLDRSLVNAVPLGLATMIPAVQCQLDTGLISIWEGQYQHYNIKTSGAVVGHVVAIVQEIPIDQRHCQGEDEYSWGCADTGEYWSGPASGNARAAAAPDRGHGSTGGLGSSVEERRRRGGGRGSFANSSRHRRGGVRRSSAASPRRGTRIVSEQVAATPRRRTRIVCRRVAARPPRTGRGERDRSPTGTGRKTRFQQRSRSRRSRTAPRSHTTAGARASFSARTRSRRSRGAGCHTTVSTASGCSSRSTSSTSITRWPGRNTVTATPRRRNGTPSLRRRGDGTEHRRGDARGGRNAQPLTRSIPPRPSRCRASR